VEGEEINLLDIMSPAGIFEEGVRKREWDVQSVPGFSAKRMPEFKQRRSIKSMFAAPVANRTQSSTTQTFGVGNEHADGTTAAVRVDGETTTNGTLHSSNSAASQSTDPSPAKRKVETMVKEKSVKRQKSESDQPTSKGQQSLKGFFQIQNKSTNAVKKSNGVMTEKGDENSKGLTADGVEVDDELFAAQLGSTMAEASNSPVADIQETPFDHALPPSQAASPADTASPSPSEFSAQLAAAEQNQRSWNALFARPAAPLCESHNEPCMTMQTKKKGSNQGRSFWMCARPLGPSGNKERGTQWRCPTFIWCSDWSGKKDAAKAGE
jgi:AP endonuclease-2